MDQVLAWPQLANYCSLISLAYDARMQVWQGMVTHILWTDRGRIIALQVLPKTTGPISSSEQTQSLVAGGGCPLGASRLKRLLLAANLTPRRGKFLVYAVGIQFQNTERRRRTLLDAACVISTRP
jgi:hypothetical protein